MATYAKSATAYLIPVSVPFTRGTPPWPLPCSYQMAVYPSFSPLHEGDTSVATAEEVKGLQILSFSPLHEGDTSVAPSRNRRRSRLLRVSVPFTRGTPPWLGARHAHEQFQVFQSPSRGGHLRGAAGGFERAGSGVHVSVPFTRGTPPWPAERADDGVRDHAFQSPSRGGHLRGRQRLFQNRRAHLGFSPLHEGDTSVAADAGVRPSDPHNRFSPLHEGDTSVAG